MKNLICLIVIVLAGACAVPSGATENCCTAPDNGTGTVDFPANCLYDWPNKPMLIIDGLPVNTRIELDGPLTNFFNVVNVPGGSLGGEICTFEAVFDWTVTGTGAFAGFDRHIVMPVVGEIHIGPRNPGDPVQTFDTDIYRLSGELFGDPDFCEMRIWAGSDYGLPGPGQTTLTELPSGDFAVDSFFDITYQIDFTGCPGSVLAGMSGITTDTVARSTCTYTVDWCRLQWPLTIEVDPGTNTTVYGRVYIAGLTDQSPYNNPAEGMVIGQVGYGPPASSPANNPSWTWADAAPNPGWDGGAAGEPDNDEYMATLTAPDSSGEYDYCYRFSGDGGTTWLYGDRDTGVPGEDGSENGYQTANAGKMTVREVCCLAPDNGTGTVDFPANCPYGNLSEPMKIIEGPPPGTTLELMGPLTGFYNVVNTPGGSLGGHICTFDAYLDWTVTGTGDLAGFNRHLYVPVSGVIHTGPRNPGDPVQTFAATIDNLAGQLYGDPDFCELIFTAGDNNGMPSPGLTTLTELPSGDFAVDSFFDIVYEIEFEGCPGSQLDGYVGTTRDTVARTTCYDATYVVDWCRLQWPLIIEEYPATDVTVYGRVYIDGITDRTTGNDPVAGVVRGQVGYGPQDSIPSDNPALWTWFEASPNPGWDGGAAGEPDNDEYMATLTAPAQGGDYDFCYRFSGDAGSTWLYGDRDTGLAGEDGSENGYQPLNAGKMTVWEICCLAPDNGSGTVDFPADCPFDHSGDPMRIIDGPPPGTTLELAGPLTDIINVTNVPGGTLGGEICTFDATLDWTVTGTGDLAGFSRHLWVPVSGEIHIGPRTPGYSIQGFDAEIMNLSGQLFGDPDFCELIFTAGSSNGLPGPGHATLTELPSGDFAVDSFFDITYEIEFEGCPGSQLDGYVGTTRDTVWRSTCGTLTEVVESRPEPEIPTRLSFASSIPNPFAVSTTITYAIPAGAENSRVTLKVFDITGRLVQTLVNSSQPVGLYYVSWDGQDRKGNRVASGIYFCRLSAGREAVTERIVLLR